MRALQVAISSVVATAALASFSGQLPAVAAGTRLETALRNLGFIDGERLAEAAYADLWNAKADSGKRAIATFREALIADVASPYRWCDIGQAFADTGQERNASYCFARAVSLGPSAPPILMRAANAYFELGDVDRALGCTSRVLAIVPVYDQIIFSMYRRLAIPTHQILRDGLPATDPRAAASFVRYLVSQRLPDDALKTWNHMERRHLANDKLADEFVSALLAVHRPREAVDLWIAHLGSRAADHRKPDCLFNAGFEHEPYGSTFDWHIEQSPNVTTQWDSAASYSGRFSLRIEFAGNENLAYSGVKQIAFVTPGLYLFEARVRTSQVTTEQGIAFRISDAENSDRLSVTTPSLVGTQDWTLVKKQVAIKAPTSLVEVAVVRDRSLRFDSAIRGSAWIDEVHLIRQR